MTTENEVTSTEQSAEDKFLGVRTVIDTDDHEDDLVVETETPEATPVDMSAEDNSLDDDMSGYSDKVQKRINHLTWKAKEAEREADRIRQENAEAVNYAQGLVQKTQHYEQLLSTGEAQLVEQIKSKAALAVEAARSGYTKAYEEGDTQEILKAQEALISAQAEAKSANEYDMNYQNRVAQWQHGQRQQQQRQFQQPQAQQPPRPSSKSLTWADRNEWFQNPKHRDMTAVAYAKHETLIRDDGVKPDTDEYYEAIDAEVRKIFPHYFDDQGTGQQAASGRQAPQTVVASGERQSGGKLHKKKLTPTQVALAKKLGLTLEQYARQL